MAQHRRGASTGQDSAVHQHLKVKGHYLEDSNVHVLDREDGWLERRVKEAIYIHLEMSFFKQKGEPRHHFFVTNYTVLEPPQ